MVQGDEPFLMGSNDFSTSYLRGYQLLTASYSNAGTLNQPVTGGSLCHPAGPG